MSKPQPKGLQVAEPTMNRNFEALIIASQLHN